MAHGVWWFSRSSYIRVRWGYCHTPITQPLFNSNSNISGLGGGTVHTRDRTKCGAEQICVADLNDDNLWIYRAYLRISDYCKVTFRVRVRVRVRVSIRVGVGVADCCILTARKSDKMWINQVIKTDQRQSAPLRILSCPYALYWVPLQLLLLLLLFVGSEWSACTCHLYLSSVVSSACGCKACLSASCLMSCRHLISCSSSALTSIWYASLVNWKWKKNSSVSCCSSIGLQRHSSRSQSRSLTEKVEYLLPASCAHLRCVYELFAGSRVYKWSFLNGRVMVANGNTAFFVVVVLSRTSTACYYCICSIFYMYCMWIMHVANFFYLL